MSQAAAVIAALNHVLGKLPAGCERVVVEAGDGDTKDSKAVPEIRKYVENHQLGEVESITWRAPTQVACGAWRLVLKLPKANP